MNRIGQIATRLLKRPWLVKSATHTYRRCTLNLASSVKTIYVSFIEVTVTFYMSNKVCIVYVY